VRVANLGYTFGLSAAVAMLFGCGVSQPRVGAPGAMPQALALATHAERGKSWMLPEAKRDNLLYVSDQGTSDVYFFSYPGAKLVGTITGVGTSPTGLCVDASQNVWVTSGSATFKFAHGGTTVLAALSPDEGQLVGCSIDLRTGNLAAASLSGDVVVFRDATGSPTTYTDSALYRAWACGYDNHGNLFVDGLNDSGGFQFAELPHGRGSLVNVTLDAKVAAPGGVQWDGKYVAVEDSKEGVIYQTTGAGGQVVSYTDLNQGCCEFGQFWKQGSRVTVAFVPNTGVIGYWKYPAGGNPTKIVKGFDQPFGVAISKGQR